MEVNTKHAVSKVKKNLRKKYGKEAGRVRMFFNGKELKDESLIGQHGIESGYVLQVYVAKI